MSDSLCLTYTGNQCQRTDLHRRGCRSRQCVAHDTEATRCQGQGGLDLNKGHVLNHIDRQKYILELFRHVLMLTKIRQRLSHLQDLFYCQFFIEQWFNVKLRFYLNLIHFFVTNFLYKNNWKINKQLWMKFKK